MGMSFDIRASIDVTPDPKIMKSFQCTLNGTGVEWVLQNINSTYTLLNWCYGLQGNMYDGQGIAASNNSGLILEQYLNTLVMVAAGNNYLTSTPAITAGGGGITQGCLVPRASLPLEIILLFVIVSIFLLAILVDFIMGYGFKVGETLHHANGDYHKPPNSLLDWMAQAVREHIFRDDATATFKEQDLKSWGFSRRDNGIGLGVQALE